VVPYVLRIDYYKGSVFSALTPQNATCSRDVDLAHQSFCFNFSSERKENILCTLLGATGACAYKDVVFERYLTNFFLLHLFALNKPNIMIRVSKNLKLPD